MSADLQAWASNPTLATLTADELDQIASLARVERWGAGATLLHEGAGGPRVLIVLEGEAVVSRRDRGGEARELARVGPGAVLGEILLLTGFARIATVRTATPVTALALDVATVRAAIERREPAVLALVVGLASGLAARVAALNERVVALLHEVEHYDEIAETRELVRRSLVE